VSAIWRYPVKSMGAEALEQAEVSWHGLAGDRRWAFVRDGLERSGFPWLTIRERAEMWRFQPSFVDPSRPDESRTTVRTPDGGELDVVDPALASRLGAGTRVIKQNRGVFDVMPLSLITTRSIEAIGALVGTELAFNRFRPNLLIEPSGEREFPEDDWVGAELQIGGLRMRVDQRDERCVMVNVDPVASERNPAVLRTIASHRNACLGVYGSTVVPGSVAVGDTVVIQRR
jgi:MOSC domain-containing protein